MLEEIVIVAPVGIVVIICAVLAVGVGLAGFVLGIVVNDVGLGRYGIPIGACPIK